MPAGNKFRHQSYPTQPIQQPVIRSVTAEQARGAGFERLHTQFAVRDVLIVHGTFMGDDPFGVADMLRTLAGNTPAFAAALDGVAAGIQARMKPLADSVAGDVGNYTQQFADKFREITGGDPAVELLKPTWSGQNHHLARADLAVRLLCRLTELAPTPDQRILLWGHSHAGNAFAILSNLLANDRESVAAFFEAVSDQPGDSWKVAQQELAAAPSPHPLANSVIIAAFGTPVRYGWDTTGFRHLTHFLHHRVFDENNPFISKPLFPPHSLPDTLTARYGDWVQSFGIAGTDVATPVSIGVNQRLQTILESGLAEPVHELDTRFLTPKRIRDACARWKTGTRCHADGRNLLLSYEPCGRKSVTGYPIEQALLGHGVATTLDWLPTHLALLLEVLEQDGADRRRDA
ncbi:MAG: hypothetical protein R3C19_15725 [Planctomycetaceae bacterium]